MIDQLNGRTKIGTLEHVFEQILSISKGECLITDEMLTEVEDEKYFNVLSGLQMLHEDLALYKEELKAQMESEFQIKVLKKKNEELAQFNYAASHDLQEPLRTIQSFSGLLLRNKSDGLDEEAKEYLNFITSSTDRMRTLLLALLNYTKVGENIKFETFCTYSLVKDVILDLNSRVVESSAEIKILELPEIHGDKTRLRQVFQNVISNALKFKKEEEPLCLKISAVSNASEHVFCIEDNGIGIEKYYLNKIFDVFKRLPSVEKIEGTGIGLAICKKNIDLHNGRIWVESEPGKGSMFFIALPRK